MDKQDYISREEARSTLSTVTNDSTCPLSIASEIDFMLDMIPAVDVAPVRYGQWVYDDFDIPHCSECGHEVMPNCISAFCSVCGAKMEGRV